MSRRGVGDDQPGAARLRGKGCSSTTPAAPRSSASRTKAMAVVARPAIPGRHEYLARFEPAMIVGAAKDVPVRTSDELGFRKNLPQADRGNPPLGQTVNEPARHRHTPPCFALCIARGCSVAGIGSKPSTAALRPRLPGRAATCWVWFRSLDHTFSRGLDRDQPAITIREPSIRRNPSRWMPRLKRRHCWPKPGKRQSQPALICQQLGSVPGIRA